MTIKIAMLHTVASNAAVLGPLIAAQVAPALGLPADQLDVLHMVDENLLRDTIDHGLLPRTVRRVAAFAAFAEESGAQAVLVTCSSIGAAVEAARPMVGVPVLRIDQPMATEAVRLVTHAGSPAGAAADGSDCRESAARTPSGRIGVTATLSSTLEPTADLIRRIAAEEGVAVQVRTVVASGAFAALRAGDTDAHDAAVARTVRELADGCDVVVLAQASMARAVRAGAQVPVPVLTSTVSGVRQLISALAGAAARSRPAQRQADSSTEVVTDPSSGPGVRPGGSRR